jgi:hypothetical protein
MADTIATTFCADTERMLRALGVDARNVTRVTLDLLPASVVMLTVERAVTERQVAALAGVLEAEPLKPIKP